MKPKEAVINMISTLTDMDINDCDEDTDDEVMQCKSAFMVTSRSYNSIQANKVPIVSKYIKAIISSTQQHTVYSK